MTRGFFELGYFRLPKLYNRRPSARSVPKDFGASNFTCTVLGLEVERTRTALQDRIRPKRVIEFRFDSSSHFKLSESNTKSISKRHLTYTDFTSQLTLDIGFALTPLVRAFTSFSACPSPEGGLPSELQESLHRLLRPPRYPPLRDVVGLLL